MLGGVERSTFCPRLKDWVSRCGAATSNLISANSLNQGRPVLKYAIKVLAAMIDRFFTALALITSTAFAAQPHAPSPLEAPIRDLTLGQINFLATTDTHGWHAGHLQEPSYSADWGDYYDFARLLREHVEANGQDLLVIDTGDRIEGNGLYDASEPKGKYTFDIFREQHIDVICSGNHELYKQNSSETEYFVTVPDFRDSYLASNLDIYDPKTGELVSLAPRYKKFTTKKQGIRILAFGFLFDFLGNYNNTVVRPVAKTIQEPWFQEAIRDRDIDLFLVIGHVPVRSSPEFDAVYKAIREVQWDTPIQFFGGHTHIRDYKKYDSKSYGLESGRFMETIGFQSIDGISTAKSKKSKAQASPKFFRRYIDNNLFSFYHHSGQNSSTFHSDHGRNISRAISHARKALELDTTFGCARNDLWMSRAKYPSNNSIFTWLEERVLPDVVQDKNRLDKPRIAIANTGAIRFDIFKGPFTKDSTYIVSPFTSGFRFIKDVPFGIANKLLPLLNSGGQIFQETDHNLQSWMLAPPEQRGRTEDFVVDNVDKSQLSSQQMFLGSKLDLTPGYTTKDDAGNDGDDTIHSSISFYRVPNCIQAIINPSKIMDEPVTVDVVYNEFIEPWIILAFRFLGLEFNETDTAPYMEGETMTHLIAKWVSENWKDNC
jgi:2',3'-cyclic-nucleotide 2'-phosphodiesterase (5'-nucleotidase family)